jgi:hypothetical protein
VLLSLYIEHDLISVALRRCPLVYCRYMPLSVYIKGGERVHDSNSIAHLQHCEAQPLLIEHNCSWKAHSGAVALVAVALSQPPSWYTLGEQDGIQQVRALHGVPLGDFPLPNLSEVCAHTHTHITSHHITKLLGSVYYYVLSCRLCSTLRTFVSE